MLNKAYLLYAWFRHQVLTVPGRVCALIFFIFLLIFPLLTQETYFLRIVTLACIFALFAASWDVLAGFTGQLNLGQGLFFGVSAYTAALLNLHFELSPWITIPCGAVLAVAVGLIVGLPALRLRGIYLALVTLAFPAILGGLIYLAPDFTGGELGLFGVGRLSESRVTDFYIVALITAASLMIMWYLTDPKRKIIRIGILLCAIREDEIAARIAGIGTTKYKLIAFCISGFFAGVAGGLYAHYLRLAGPSTLDLFFSFQPILWTVFGGISTIYGSVVGVFILYPLVEILSLFATGESLRHIVFALVLILILLFMPEGVSVWILDRIEIRCPRCKLTNAHWKKKCRACRADLHKKGME
jgi:branched-chain amino acid transport system permease protein